MASYIDSNLSKGEEVIARAHVSWLSQLFTIIGGVICLLVSLILLAAGVGFGWFTLLLTIFALVKMLVIIMTTELALTNKRVIAKFGFIRRTTIELRLSKVESIGVNQGILGRMLGYGDVVVRGTGGTGTPIPAIRQPLDFRRVVNNYIEESEEKA